MSRNRGWQRRACPWCSPSEHPGDRPCLLCRGTDRFLRLPIVDDNGNIIEHVR